MNEFICDPLAVTPREAAELRRSYFREHGTTMRGLMTVNRIDPHEFLAFVHEVDLACVPADPALVAALRAAAGPQDRPHQRLGAARRDGCSSISASATAF